MVLQQDFAKDVVTENARENVRESTRKNIRPSAKVRQRASMQSLSVKPVMLGAAGLVAGLFMLTLLLVGSKVDASVATMQEEWLEVQPLDLSKGAIKQKVVLQPGDATVSALGKLGFPFAEAMQMSQASKSVYSLRQVRAGQAFWREDEASKTHVYYNIDSEQRLHLYASQGETWQAEVQPREINRRQARASGKIEDSLFSAALAAGMDERTTMNLIDIFSWDIDFARDLRTGDRFTVLYEEQYDESGKLLNSVILSAEFINQGEVYQAVRYTLANGNTEYFTPDGRSMRKTYLKSPVKFSRISSRFSTSRKHPVLGYTRAHRGVDYAASSGTPIRAIGDGRVVTARWKGGYGRFVEIKHTNSAHSTAYAHLRAYGRGIKHGKRVKQGQIIGYVGMSGLATGPHLHFEFRVRGRAVNPLAIKHAPAKPVPAGELARFREITSRSVARLNAPLLAVAWE